MKRSILVLLACLCLSAYGQTNYVMNFNGSSASVDVGTSVGNGVRSIEFWFKPASNITASTSHDGYSFIVRNDNSEFHEYGAYIRGADWFSNNGQMAFYMRDNGTMHEIYSNASSWTAGTWYHFAGVVDPINGMQMYINGVLQSDTDPTFTITTQTDNSSSNIGCWGDAAVRYFDGRIEEMRLWSRALTQNEIQTKMCQDLVPANETGLHAYWKFNEGSGMQIVDATTNNFNGTVSGTTWISDSPCATPSNYVMDFNGSSGSVDVGTTVGNGLRSIEFWFKPAISITPGTSHDGYSFIIRNDNTQFHEYGVYIRGADWTSNVGQMAFFIRNNGAFHEIYSNATSWTAGVWYHFAGVVDPTGGMKMYINGVSQTSTDVSCTIATQTDNNSTNIGTFGNALVRYFDGRIDEMRLWSRAITQSEIQTKMCQNLVVANETGLQAYWKFNEGSGAQILDATTNGNNGMITSTTWIADNYCAAGVHALAPQEVNVSIYPNPTDGLVYVSMPNNYEKATYLVYNSVGQAVLAGEISAEETRLELGQLISGVYYIAICKEAQVIRKKLIVQK